MISVKPFGILVEGEGRGGKDSGDPVIGTSGDRKSKTIPRINADDADRNQDYYSAPSDRPLTVSPSLATMAGSTWPP